MAFAKTAVTRKDFQSRIERYLIAAKGAHCMAEVATANAYPHHVPRWRDEVERILFIDLNFYADVVITKTRFNRRRAIDNVIAEHRSANSLRASLLAAKKLLAAQYLMRPHANLKMPDVEPSMAAFWLMVSEAVRLAIERGT